MKKRIPVLLVSIFIFSALIYTMRSSIEKSSAYNPQFAGDRNDIFITVDQIGRYDCKLAVQHCIPTDFLYDMYLDFTSEYEELIALHESSSAEADANELSISSDSSSVANDTAKVIYQEGFSYEPIPDAIQAFIYGKSYKEDCTVPLSSLRYVKIRYYDFSNIIKDGELICNETIAQDLVEIFYELYCAQYPLEEVTLVDYYNADDELSMEHNNTSCFNYRTVPGKQTLSKHSQGLAIDINPFYNPYVVSQKDGSTLITPIGSDSYANRENDFPYKITSDDLCCQLFLAHGFSWGGNWNSVKDYQHFEK